jgi:hypothetical protein
MSRQTLDQPSVNPEDFDSLREYQEAVQREMTRLAKRGDDVLIDLLMTLRKTYWAGHLVELLPSQQIAVYTRQWATREQIYEYATSCSGIDGSDVVILPTLQRHCDTYNEEKYPEWTEAIRTLQRQGATVSDIHEYNSTTMPCQQEGRCTYQRKADFDQDTTDLIIGSPQHAYVNSYNEGRIVVLDENAAGSYETKLTDDQVKTAISAFLKTEDGVDAETLADLRRMTPQEQVAMIDHINNRSGGVIDSKLGLSPKGRRADSPLLVLGKLTSQRMPESKFARAEIEISGGRTAIFLDDEEQGGVTVRKPPALRTCRNVIALDGTPHHEMWETRLDRDLDYHRFLSDEERREYIRDILGYRIIQTSSSINPYSSGDYVQERQILALLEHAYRRNGDGTLRGGTPVPFISSQNARGKVQSFAETQYEEFVSSDELYFNKIRSHNELADDTRLVIGGSHHPGDREIQRLAALDGYDVPEGEGKGEDKTYGDVGDRYYHHEVYATTAQAIFRVARSDDIDGAEIFVHTAAILDWIPVEYVSDEKIRVRTDEEHMSIQALEELEVATTAEIADMVDHGERCVRKHLNNLAREGYVEKREERGKAVWRDVGLEEVYWWGEVDLPEYRSVQR